MVDDSWFHDNHFYLAGSLTPGTGVTTGPAGFMNEGAADFRPGPGSPLKNRLAPLTPVDAHNALRTDPTSVGAFQ